MVFSSREEALKMSSKQSWEKNSLSLKLGRPKKAEQLFLVPVARQALQDHVPGFRLQQSIGKPHAQRIERYAWFLKRREKAAEWWDFTKQSAAGEAPLLPT